MSINVYVKVVGRKKAIDGGKDEYVVLDQFWDDRWKSLRSWPGLDDMCEWGEDNASIMPLGDYYSKGESKCDHVSKYIMSCDSIGIWVDRVQERIEEYLRDLSFHRKAYIDAATPKMKDYEMEKISDIEGIIEHDPINGDGLADTLDLLKTLRSNLQYEQLKHDDYDDEGIVPSSIRFLLMVG